MNITELAEEIVKGKGYVVIPDLLSFAEAKAARNLILQLAKKERQQDKLDISDRQRLRSHH